MPGDIGPIVYRSTAQTDRLDIWSQNYGLDTGSGSACICPSGLEVGTGSHTRYRERTRASGQMIHFEKLDRFLPIR